MRHREHARRQDVLSSQHRSSWLKLWSGHTHCCCCCCCCSAKFSSIHTAVAAKTMTLVNIEERDALLQLQKRVLDGLQREVGQVFSVSRGLKNPKNP